MQSQEIINKILQNAQAHIKHYHFRSAQAEMAGRILKALNAGEHLTVEAGTGTGKTIAYLIAAVLYIMETGERAFVATFSRALQDQIIEKDLPLLKKIMGSEFRIKYTVSFGSSNYLCLWKKERHSEELFRQQESRNLHSWLQKTHTGLFKETDLPTSLVSMVSRDPDLCLRKNCPFYQDCFYYTARNKERQSDLLILNQHLFFSHVANEHKLLPSAKIVIMDEAHQVENVATSYLADHLNLNKVLWLLHALYRNKSSFLKTNKIRKRGLTSALRELENDIVQFFSILSNDLQDATSKRIKEPFNFNLDHIDYLFGLCTGILIKTDIDRPEEYSRELAGYINRLKYIQNILHVFCCQSREEYIYSLHQDWKEKQVELRITPLVIAPQFQERVLNHYGSVIFTSATLTVAKSFNYFLSTVTLESDLPTLMLPPVFDYKKQVRLYIPEHGTDTPPEPDYLLEQILPILTLTQGYAFILFTNFKILNYIYKKLSGSVPYPLIRQKDSSPFRLLNEFQNKPGSVLLGNITFWQGVDIPGPALKNVIITRLPFQVPTDPVVEARAEFYEQTTGNGFLNFQVPRTAILLKQGFGRLIRNHHDTGIISILDTRIRKKFYGRILLKSLPDTEITASTRVLEDFLSENIDNKTREE